MFINKLAIFLNDVLYFKYKTNINDIQKCKTNNNPNY